MIAEHGKTELEQEIKEQEEQKIKNENRVVELKRKLEEIEIRNKERVVFETKRRDDEKRFIVA